MSFFFTLLDDSLRPRGSRDPLGLELVWAGVGRGMIGNLTTVTAHLENFTFALLGFHFASAKDGAPRWESFQRFEQLTGYARAQLGRSAGLLGRRKIRKKKDLDPLPCGGHPQAAILDNQRQAGMWGLYASALEACGVLGRERRLTPDGLELVGLLAPGKRPAWLENAFDSRTTSLSQAEFTQVVDSVRKWRQSGAARDALADRLLSGGAGAPEKQQVLHERAVAYLGADSQNQSVRGFLASLQAVPGPLQEYARRVEQIDHVCIFANVVFYGILGCHGKERTAIARDHLAPLGAWPGMGRLLMPAFPEVKGAHWAARARGLGLFATAMAHGEHARALDALIDHHAAIAVQRGGAPWCHWEGGLLKVMSSGSAQAWPARQDLVEDFRTWVEPRTMDFFLGSFLAVLSQSTLGDDSPMEDEA